MRKIEGKRIPIQFPTELWNRIEQQREKEGRTAAEFIRRVLDRYLLEQEFRGPVDEAAQKSIAQNQELLKKLRNS
jgi:predicted DNA-binding protein